jgi:hypothetical protein
MWRIFKMFSRSQVFEELDEMYFHMEQIHTVC